MKIKLEAQAAREYRRLWRKMGYEGFFQQIVNVYYNEDIKNPIIILTIK